MRLPRPSPRKWPALVFAKLPRPSLATWAGIVFVGIAGVAMLVWWLTDALDEWAPNVAVEALSIAATIVIVERIVRREARERLRPRVERVLYDIGLDFRLLMTSVVLDYASTHVDTYRPIPRDAVAVLEQWLADHNREDEPRRPVEGQTVPTLLLSATEFGKQLLWYRDTDREVMEPDLVRAIDDMTHRISLSVRMLGWIDRSPEEQLDVERTALAGFVRVLRDFALVFRKYDARWMEIKDLTVEAADATREHDTRGRHEGPTLR